MNGILARDVFHLILQREFSFLDRNFFELLTGGKVMLVGELVEAVVQLVVAFG